MYRFQVIAHTQPGYSIGIVGSTPELGGWDFNKAVRLSTNKNSYPLWWADINIPSSSDSHNYEAVEYK